MSPVDINQIAVHIAMELYDIENKQECFRKVLIMAQSWLTHIREKKG